MVQDPFDEKSAYEMRLSKQNNMNKKGCSQKRWPFQFLTIAISIVAVVCHTHAYGPFLWTGGITF